MNLTSHETSPLLHTLQSVQASDRYAYVNNNPVNGIDPTGMWMCGDQYDPACSESNEEYASFLAMESHYSADLPDKLYYTQNFGGISLTDAFHQGVLVDFGLDSYVTRNDLGYLLEQIALDLINRKESNWLRRISRLDLARNGYDTPMFSGGGMDIVLYLLGGDPFPDVYPSKQAVCLDYLGCYGRSEVNYVAQGMWDAIAGAS